MKHRRTSKAGVYDREAKGLKGPTHPRWKEKINYVDLHRWVADELGKPNKCDHCGTKEAKRFEWANKSGQYLHDLSDWLRLCSTCHRKHDQIALRLQSKPKKKGTSKFKGVYWFKPQGRWRVEISQNSKKILVGYFHDEREAARMYNEAAQKMHGPHAYLNQL